MITIKKLSNILTYCDSEPIEVLLGLTWLFVFPIICTIQIGFEWLIIFPSIILGYVIIKGVVDYEIRIRKALAYAGFLFSLLISGTFLFNHNILDYPTQVMWLLISLLALFNLVNISKRYYRILKKCKTQIT